LSELLLHNCTRYDPSPLTKTHSLSTTQGNTLFHVDSSFNPRRASYSLLRAAELPPPGTRGGNTEFADSRTAFDELPDGLKNQLIQNDYVAAHSLWQSRKLASPEAFRDVEPLDYYMSRNRLVQMHEVSGRLNLYIAAHVHHIEGLPATESEKLVKELLAHTTQQKYVLNMEWRNVGDLVIWDNTCVLHRAVPVEGRWRRDMRRATVHDGSNGAWGLNERSDLRQGLP
jgi:alpha-ketoglutarate-dependent 2,4-dichlorophenoxyacetate dioxygenase